MEANRVYHRERYARLKAEKEARRASSGMPGDPPCGDVCARPGCGKPVALKDTYARGHRDPFCSASCCRLYHGVGVPGDGEKRAAAGTARLLS
jgi:hypothetical protein